MSNKQQCYLSNMNCGIIFILSVVGLLMDGIQVADVMCTFALIIWLWQPLFIKYEAKALKFISSLD